MKLALAGDTMLGRGVAGRLNAGGPNSLFAPELVDITRSADLFVLNLECAISDRGERWPDRRKPFFFRAPPAAVDTLRWLGVDCVNLANNHSLDYGTTAFGDTLQHLADADIAVVGAGHDRRSARRPVVLRCDGLTIGIIGATDHPADYEAQDDRPGVAFADMRNDEITWLVDSIGALTTDMVVVTPHWGPNMVDRPIAHVRRTAASLLAAGATLVAGHSAHVFHGVADRVLYDLGDFIDDYAVDPLLRNDLGLLFLVTLAGGRPVELEAVPLAIDRCRTRLADREETRWISRRFRAACADLGTDVKAEDDRLVVEFG